MVMTFSVVRYPRARTLASDPAEPGDPDEKAPQGPGAAAPVSFGQSPPTHAVWKVRPACPLPFTAKRLYPQLWCRHGVVRGVCRGSPESLGGTLAPAIARQPLPTSVGEKP